MDAKTKVKVKEEKQMRMADIKAAEATGRSEVKQDVIKKSPSRGRTHRI